MSDIAHEMKVRPARVFAGDMGPYVLLSPQERDEAVAEIDRLRRAIREALEYLESDANVTWEQRSGNATFVLNAVLADADGQG